MSKKRVLTKEIAEQFSKIQELKKLEHVLKALNFLNPERDLLRIFDLRDFLVEDAADACISYDSECIYDDDSYAEIIELYECAGIQSDEVTVNSCFYNKEKQRAGISFTVNGYMFEGDWVQADDWLSDEFDDLLGEAESKMNGKILLVPGTCQAVIKLYVPAAHASMINDSFERLYELEKSEWDLIDNKPVILPDVLTKFISIQNDAAYFLANCNYDLNLDGLTQISDEATHSLSKNKGKLSLNGLVELSDASAESLSRFEGHSLELNGLPELSDAAAESLSKIKGELSLNGLTRLGDTSGHVALAEKLLKKQNLSLDSLIELSDSMAERLSKHLGSISLDGLTKLSDEAIFFLAKIPEDNLFLSKEIATQIRSYHKNQKAEDFRTVKDSIDTNKKEQKKEKLQEQKVEKKGGLPQSFLDLYN